MVDEFGGLAKVMPIYAAIFVIVTMSSIGVPGTNGFISEFIIVSSTFVSERLGTFAGVHTVGAAAGVILAAVYMLTVVQKTFFGPLTNPKNAKLNDLTARETLALAPLVVMIFVIGLFPSLFLDRMTESVKLAYDQFKTVSGQTVLYSDDRDAKMLPADILSPAFLKGAPVNPKDPKKEGEPTGPAPQAALPQTREVAQ
jgi:NADH-quinone oxidoreductase subunit M